MMGSVEKNHERSDIADDKSLFEAENEDQGLENSDLLNLYPG
jgi:hypothetical protein